MSNAPAGPGSQPLRSGFSAELDQLRLQVELTAVRVDHLDPRLTRELISLDRSDAAEVAIRTLVAGRSLERIADHAGVTGAPTALPAHGRHRAPRERGPLMLVAEVTAHG